VNSHDNLRRALPLILTSAMALGCSPTAGARESDLRASRSLFFDSEKAAKGLTLKTERELKFTTDEGTWITVDVSPDGKQIVFDLLGHIYLMPITGGEAKAITSGQGFDSMPHFSPDGNRIVFISDRSRAENVWVANADGTHLERLTEVDTISNGEKPLLDAR
jgi:Tol biopolymer transport system component